MGEPFQLTIDIDETTSTYANYCVISANANSAIKDALKVHWQKLERTRTGLTSGFDFARDRRHARRDRVPAAAT
jgi:hypothetical protein